MNNEKKHGSVGYGNGERRFITHDEGARIRRSVYMMSERISPTVRDQGSGRLRWLCVGHVVHMTVLTVWTVSNLP